MSFTTLASGAYLEALGVAPDGVWYSDVVRGGIHRVEPDGATTTFLADKQWIGALLPTADGRILSSGAGGIAWTDPVSGAGGMLLDAIDGVAIPGINEMAPDGRGGIVFGTVDLPAIRSGGTLGPASIHRLSIHGTVTTLLDGLKFSNGLGFSADGTRFYHNESFVGVFAYAVAGDGSLGDGRLLLEKYDCDGMAFDRDGGIWISGFTSAELIRLLPDGTVDATIALPGKAATNVRFGGADGRDLYVTTVDPETVAALTEGRTIDVPTSRLIRGRAERAGQPTPPPAFRLG